MTKRFAALALAGAMATSCFAATPAQAAGWIVGLVDGNTLVIIDPKTRKVTNTAKVSGAGTLLGVDVRPMDGMLYGIDDAGNIVTVDVKSGKATMKSKVSEPWEKGAATSFDFNPAADRLRLMSSKGVSFRINVDDGKVTKDGSHKYKEGDTNAGKTPQVVAGAYTNSLKEKPKATTLYNIDMATGALVTQVPPNDGTLNTVGMLGASLSGPVAFNIVSMGEDKNEAWLAAGGNLYAVDLKTGKATMAGKIEGVSGKLTDIAWIN